jgi:hypothetical protein
MFCSRIIVLWLELKKPAQIVPVKVLELVWGVLFFPGSELADGLVVKEVVKDVLHGVLKPFLEFFEVFLVEEDLVFVVGEGAVSFLAALAFRDGQVIVVIAFGGFYVKEVGALTGTHGLGINVFRIPLLAMGPLIIFTIHSSPLLM